MFLIVLGDRSINFNLFLRTLIIMSTVVKHIFSLILGVMLIRRLVGRYHNNFLGQTIRHNEKSISLMLTLITDLPSLQANSITMYKQDFLRTSSKFERFTLRMVLIRLPRRLFRLPNNAANLRNLFRSFSPLCIGVTGQQSE